MTVARFAVSFDAGLAKKLRAAVGEGTISAWLADAAERKLRAEGILAVVAEWESKHGALDDVRLPAKRARTRRRR